MRRLLFLISYSAIFTFSSCGHSQDHHHHGSANEYMHRSSIEQLIANFENPERDEYQQPSKVIEFIGPVDGIKIMDLGAGSGYFTFRLAEAGAKVIAADVNDEFQNYIRTKINEYNLDSLGIELRKIPYDSPLLERNEVNKVLLVNTYHHIENRKDYFSKVKDGLKDDGELVVIDYFKKDIPVGPPKGHKISREVVIRELKEAGYSDVSLNLELLPYQYVVVAKK